MALASFMPSTLGTVTYNVYVNSSYVTSFTMNFD